MKPLLCLTLAVSCFALSSSGVSGSTVTLTVEVSSGGMNPTYKTNVLDVPKNQVAEVTSYYIPGGYGALLFEIDGKEFYTDPTKRPSVAGPAKVKLVTYANPGVFEMRSYATIRLTPESFPPDKTIIIPEGTAGATITLECSTNLLNWSTATNGFYSGTNSSKFFRIRAERAP
jgi:hypothetical protein